MTTSPDLSIDDLPDLTDPILIVAWHGWNDGGESASTAAEYLVDQLGGRPFARIDAEEFYDFTETRPLARYRGDERYIVWPETEFVHLRTDGGRDVVVGVGVEPHFRWRRYIGALSELVETLGVKLIISLGSVGAETPHTRPVNVRGSANNSQLAQRFNMHPSRFEGPSGIVGVFHDHCRRQGVSGVSLWASVPYYLSGMMPNPVGAQALLRVVGEMTGLRVNLEPLEQDIQEFHERVEKILTEHHELRSYVEQLEASTPASGDERPVEGELPSADALIADLEDFFRQGGDNGGSN